MLIQMLRYKAQDAGIKIITHRKASSFYEESVPACGKCDLHITSEENV